MRRFYATFSGSQYEATTNIIVKMAPEFGADCVLVYDDYWLRQQEFYTLNKWIFDLPDLRGVCWFAFKPFVIMHALETYCDPGDVVLFTDADTYPIANLSVLYEQCAKDGGIMLFAAMGCNNKEWVKADCWAVMAAQEKRPGRIAVPTDSQHGVARFMLFQKGPWRVKQFLAEWLTYCLNPLATTFATSVITSELPTVTQHRAEQAIMTLLGHKYGQKFYREACQFGATQDEDKGLYPQLFCQEWGGGPRTLDGSAFRNV